MMNGADPFTANRSFPMTMIGQVAAALQDVLSTIAQHLGHETHFVQRESKLGGAYFVQTLVFTYLANPDATLDELTQTAAALGVEITPSGLTQRFTQAAATLLQDVLAAAVQRLLAADPLAIPLLERFAGVFLEDSTVIVLPEALRELWPGCGTAGEHGSAALKVNLRVDLCTGVLAGLSLHAGRIQARTAAEPLSSLPAGALYLADLGYFSLERLLQISEQAYFFSRLPVQTAGFDADGRRWEDLAALLEAHGPRVELPVTLGVRRRRLRAAARRKGPAVSARRLALADWTIFVTNAPRALLTLEAAVVLGRARWQIELLFKLWKSHGQIDESRSTKAWRGACGGYVKLVGVVLKHLGGGGS